VAHAVSFLETSTFVREGRFVLRSWLSFCVTVPRPSPSHLYVSAVIDKASCVLAQPVLLGLSSSYRARADRGEVPYTTLHHRACGRRSMEEKAQS
jgi:hypothetical protein